MNPHFEIFQKQKRKSFELRASSAAERKGKLKNLRQVLMAYEDRMIEAVQADFGKPAVETLLTELLLTLHEIHTALRNLDDWMRPKRVPSGMFLLGAGSEIHSDPRGVCLIISPWNYPWQLSLSPLVAALAAGNTVLLKPSELTPACSALLKEMLESIFDESEVAVFLGDKEVSTSLLDLPVDHIFFTGSTPVGKIVMAAAAKALATVTLELGGKSPAVVDASADLDWAAERLIWGKWVNAGQTCVAPDTLYVHESVWPQLREKMRAAAAKFSAANPQDLSSIISPRHRDRLQALSEEAKKTGWSLAFETSSQGRQWPIQVFERKNPDEAERTILGREEIFGPVLGAITYRNIDEVLGVLARQEKPLALYLFSRDEKLQERILRETTSGGVVVNDVLVHLANSHLPFGGVNASGHGSYHGEFGFRAFSHEKAVLRQGALRFLARFFQPPYSDRKTRLARKLLRLGF